MSGSSKVFWIKVGSLRGSFFLGGDVNPEELDISEQKNQELRDRMKEIFEEDK